MFFTFGPHHLQSFFSILPNWFAQQPILGFSGGLVSEEPSCSVGEQETWVRSLGQEDPLEKGMAPHSSILAWRIPWTEEPGRLQHTQGFPSGASGKEPACQCKRCKRHGFNPGVGKTPWRKAWQPTPVFLPGEPQGQRSLAH